MYQGIPAGEAKDRDTVGPLPGAQPQVPRCPAASTGRNPACGGSAVAEWSHDNFRPRTLDVRHHAPGRRTRSAVE